MPKLDVQTAVLITLLGVAVALIGLVFLILAEWQVGLTLAALGIAAGALGYRACDS
ncbi:hypothetical protein GEV29_09480 [Aeromicrobium sp. SMF47]|uniref:Uncharacterized protein n=1 Tax=Aeromicrobium yanjiei TaxID=2662028 RepID=A0A5Q2MG12_9ACTN|nr:MULTISPECIES: hypothetical protein [Aeromicrobium]MRJ76767.1 hypothetical protein [Aeromicrobium yanjiei]MRK01111.1 hypothetical protein [Aeromicrobium sp. S22]QGG42094.1 hypothetical protein GEV26_12345 [Aeromicrobium yanjiei]